MQLAPPLTSETARRLEWRFLPPPLRTMIERRCGSPVVEAQSQNRGFTPGFASVLICEDGSRHFVKAASARAQPVFADAYREEARKLAALPAAAPAPALLWVEDDDWVVLGIEHVEADQPARPWQLGDLDRCLDTLEAAAEVLTPAPEALALETFEAELASFVGHWESVLARRPDLAHGEEAAALAAGFAEVTRGDTVVHTDLRDDNVLLARDGRTLFCDWNWPVVGAPWLDSLLLLVGPRGDGIDVDAVIRARPLLHDVPAEAVDAVLALVTGYFLKSAGDPVPSTSPYLRDHQRWQGEVCWEWLAERRGWA
ncbi:hypothetical protein [Nocardioides coralli]|uniref:hypothetical protein n=1 Tax=Nocardioides coralli TaxID=2872154 RepID=UPI001CA42901|nr:hypothetical protein [Nocardioides coralli]QZY30253.1 hypothetical protein K6T13_06160 [Nocardioides coralli]